ncbi:MAG TPA: AsmA family protein, partial [Burkholderiaceae bacterium]|nr:AsmA family protein [Burkholderiaceae bacterium]
MNRVAKIFLSLLMIIVFPIVVGVLFIRFFNWNYAKPLLNDLTSHALERPFSINGDLSVSWTQEGKDNSWKRLVPWPHLVAQDIVVGNPKWGATQGDFIAIGKIMFSADPLSLLSYTVSIPTLVLESPEIHLLRNADGKNNWTLADEKGVSIWKFDLSRVVVSKGIAHLDDEARNIHMNGNFDTMQDGGVEGYGIAWEVAGKYMGENLDASGKGGALLDLRNQTAPYPIAAHIRYGKTRAEFKGTVTKPSDLASLDLQMNLSGASMADLYYLSGIAMPRTPAYNTEGRLTGMLSKQGAVFHYENFKGKVGSSDLTGNLEYQSTQLSRRQRPLLTGRVQSNLLLFKDLGPIIGTGQYSENEKNASHQTHSSGKVLPTQEFSFERWRSIDVD